MARAIPLQALLRARPLLSLGASIAAAVVVMAALLAFRATRPAPLPPPPIAVEPPPPERAWPTPFSVDVRALPPAADLRPGTTRVLVLGDSQASFLGLALRYRQDEAGAFVAARGVGDCSIFAVGTRSVATWPAVTKSCAATWVDDAAELRPDVTLVVMGGAFFGDKACDARWLALYEARLLQLVHDMGPSAGRVVVARVPYPIGRWRHSDVLQRVDCFNGMLVGAAAKAGAPVLDLMAHVCPTAACVEESQGKPLRPDGLHFDGVGAEETARWTLGELRRVLSSGR